MTKLPEEMYEKDDISSQKFTNDFQSMLKIIFWNSFGLFYLEFLISYTAYADLDASGLNIGSIISVQTLGYLISSFFAGSIADRFSKKKLVLFGSVGRGISYFFIYTSLLLENLTLMGMGTFLLGFGAGFFWIPLNALIAEKSHKEHRSKAYGMKSQRIGLGTTVGAALGFTFLISFMERGVPPFIVYLPIILYGLFNFYAGIQFMLKVDGSLQIYSKENLQAIKKSNKIPKRFVSGMVFLFIVMFLASINGSIFRPLKLKII